MTNRKHYFVVFILLVVGLGLYVFGKQSGDLRAQGSQTLFATGPSSLIVQQAVAGPCLGLASEANILSVFSVFWGVKEKKMSEKDQKKAWLYISQYLTRAQSFDPWFWDIYRLTNGLLVYQDGYHKQGIHILIDGAKARSWDWEGPFVAGFLAHDLLNDDALAFRLMKLAINRPDAPEMVVGLAARFLTKTETTDDSINFLRALKKTLPASYTQYIDQRINELSKKSGGQP